MNREAWLQKATKLIARRVKEKAGVEVPQDVQVSCGWPGGGSPNKRIGECWPRSRSAEGVNQVFISPRLDDRDMVLATLVHELVHATDDCASGHGKGFSKVARAVGLEGKMTSTVAGDELKAWFKDLALPAYPHKSVMPGSGRSNRSGVRVKIECPDTGMAFWVSKAGYQLVNNCPFCDGVH